MNLSAFISRRPAAPAPSRQAPERSRALALAVGGGLAYAQAARSALAPARLCARRLPLLAAGAAHAWAPLAGAWFASHWSDRMEASVWGGSAWEQWAAFAGLWLIALAGWSVAWLASRRVALWARDEFFAWAEAGRRGSGSTRG